MTSSTHLTVPAVLPRVQYTADGYQTVFPFTFVVLKTADLEVYVDATAQTAGYAVTGLADSSGGTVTFNVPPADGAGVTLRRKVAIERLSDFQEGGAFRAKVINDELDFQTLALQELEAELSRTVRLAPTAPGDLDVTLPSAAPGKAVGWSDDGKRLVNDPSDFTATVATVQQWATDADGALQEATDAAAAAASSASTAQAARDAATAGATAAGTSEAAALASATAAGEQVQSATEARTACEAQAAVAAFDAFVLRSDRAAAVAASAGASASAEAASDRAAQALARLEDVDLSLWRAERAATAAEAAALRAEAASDLPPAGITPGAVLPNWARNAT